MNHLLAPCDPDFHLQPQLHCCHSLDNVQIEESTKRIQNIFRNSANHYSYQCLPLFSLINLLLIYSLHPPLPLSSPKQHLVQHSYTVSFPICTVLFARYFLVTNAQYSLLVLHKKKTEKGYLEVFHAGGNVLFVKLFTEVKHM